MSKKSDAEDLFHAQCLVSDIPRPTPEYKFHPERKWKFDFAWPEHMIAVEIEGWGRHQTWQGFRDDCEKYNEATALGWRVFRIPADQVDLGAGIYYVEQLLDNV